MNPIPYADQLSCARAVLQQMRERNSRWTAAQEGVVHTIERQKMLQEVSDEIRGKKTEEVEV